MEFLTQKEAVSWADEIIKKHLGVGWTAQFWGDDLILYHALFIRGSIQIMPKQSDDGELSFELRISNDLAEGLGDTRVRSHSNEIFKTPKDAVEAGLARIEEILSNIQKVRDEVRQTFEELP